MDIKKDDFLLGFVEDFDWSEEADWSSGDSMGMAVGLKRPCCWCFRDGFGGILGSMSWSSRFL